MYADLRDPVLPDPARARANFHVAVKLALVFVAVLWMIQVLIGGDSIPASSACVRGNGLASWHLLGTVRARRLHAPDRNSVPLVVLGSAMLYLYPRSSRIVLPAVYLRPDSRYGSSRADRATSARAASSTACSRTC